MPRKRTGSRGSRVPPALITTCRPARSRPSPCGPRASTRRQVSKISAGSGKRPFPVSTPVRRPTAGSMTTAPRRRSVATFSWVAGCSHISVCIAGTKITGQRAVRRVLVSRSSARPWAALASMSVVQGATTTRSADWPMRTCGTSWTDSQTSVEAGLPERAAQVASPTKCRDAAVGTTRTSCPDSVNRRSSSHALYAAMPPLTPRTTLGRRSGPLPTAGPVRGAAAPLPSAPPFPSVGPSTGCCGSDCGSSSGCVGLSIAFSPHAVGSVPAGSGPGWSSVP